jgi:thiol-disulfide isomerase/thioredoxin
MKRFAGNIIPVLLMLAIPVLMPEAATAVPAPGTRQLQSSPAPKFRFRTLDGKTVTSEQLAGRPYIVNFFASWCPPCRKELPDMVALQKKYEKQGFTFIGIAFRDNAATLPDFLWELGIGYPVGMADETLVSSFGRQLPGGQLRGIPATFVVGRDGRLLKAFQGALTKADFEDLILQALRTRPVR